MEPDQGPRLAVTDVTLSWAKSGRGGNRPVAGRQEDVRQTNASLVPSHEAQGQSQAPTLWQPSMLGSGSGRARGWPGPVLSS
jgi:hypothetical protein